MVSSAGLLANLLSMRPLSRGKQHQPLEQEGGGLRSASVFINAQQEERQQQLQKARKRKGSLRKVALLGGGAQRERREAKLLTIDTLLSSWEMDDPAPRLYAIRMATETTTTCSGVMRPQEHGSLGLNISDVTPRPSMDGYASRLSRPESFVSSISGPQQNELESIVTSPAVSYTSTTDEDDVLHIPSHVPSPVRPDLSLSSGSESYFASRHRHRSILQTKSPLSYNGLSSTPLPPADPELDYSETEWWGWVVLIVTWAVFVVGMGSCLGIWSWAWDVGTTPYAPPELEDDPTLPIVGYYPALLILTCIMAWVWVLVAWVGMKYFRHAKISGE